MKKKNILSIFILLFLFNTTALFSQFMPAEISTRLANALRNAKPADNIKVLVLLKDRIDLESLDRNLYALNADINFRARTVITRLMQKASTTQAPLLAYLGEMKNANKVTYYESYWITNLIAFEGTSETIYQIASRFDVEQIDLDALLDYDRPVSMEPAEDHVTGSEIGLKVINANKLWALGITGRGRIVMNIDTGVDKNHPALSSTWRGNTVPWYHAWLDKYGNTTIPTDCDVHGTHTMGIMCGRNGTDTIGVAPDAQWIAARTICSSPHTSNTIAAFQWAMNPDSNVSTNDMPDVICNAWYDPDISNECTSIYVSTLNALEATGIAVIFSAGNNGPGASSITKPKNINTNLVNIFSVGNINGNVPFPYPISSSSSRGPSICGGTGSLLIKPEVVAPGVNVRSSVPGGGYQYISGTSMSSAHVSGAVALLKQYAPNLTGKQILEALYNTAVDLGTAGEDNDYGKGVIDVWAAYQSLGPSIIHTPLSNTENLNGPYTVNCVITSSGPPINPAMTKLFWSRNNPSITDSVSLTNTGGNNWSSGIPGNGSAATYRYYIRTADNLNRVSIAPSGAPSNLYVFTASPDNIKPVITHTQLPPCPKTQWPATVTAAITDNLGIDSGWVRWYKFSAPGVVKQFKLINISGSTYAAAFNSDTTQVAYGDSIIYRIIAQDNSSNHNKDSTQLYGFRITAVANPCIGTGNTSLGYPFYTYYMDSRTDMLYRASEITAGGGAQGNISKIGFNVVSASSQVMNGFKIKMQQTTSNSISGFTSSGWTEVYNGTYTVYGAGWQFITLHNPFSWNGTSNLLIEICFNNNSYSSNSSVNGTAANGRVAHNHQDLSSGDGCVDINNPSSSYTALPNLCMQINLFVGNKTVQTYLPMVYSLEQNYPNPFNPSTVIRYSIPKQSQVKLIIYDVLGKEVKILINEMKQAGNYEAEFDGSALASGIYLYRIEAGEYTDVKKMVLIK
jgi:subtilisin family serine protease